MEWETCISLFKWHIYVRFSEYTRWVLESSISAGGNLQCITDSTGNIIGKTLLPIVYMFTQKVKYRKLFYLYFVSSVQCISIKPAYVLVDHITPPGTPTKALVMCIFYVTWYFRKFYQYAILWMIVKVNRF